MAPVQAPSSVQLREQILRGLNEHYFGMALKTGTLIVLANTLIAAAFYSHYGSPWILVWGAAAVALPGWRIWVALRFRSDQGRQEDPLHWERQVFGITFLIALVYAFGLLVLIDDGNHVYNGLLTILYVMMIGATASSAFTMKRTMLAFCTIVGSSLAIRLAAADHPAYWFGAIFVALYAVAQMVFALQSYRLQTTFMEQSILNKALANQLEEQVRIAVKASRDATRASAEKSRFLAAASHDLRQPLHALALSADALQRKLAGSDQAQDLELLLQSVSALSDSLNAMLDLSKLDAGAVPAQLESVQVSEVFAQLHQTFLERANAKGLALRFVHRNCTVLADRHLLTRLLSNLVDNAIKYTEHGGVLVVARHKAGGGVLVEIRDSGIGIPQEHQEQIFEEFFQVGNPGRERGLGLGLGLSIVKRIAHLMSMPLAVRSALRCGTRFELTCRSAEHAAEHGVQDHPHSGMSTLRQGSDVAILRGKRVLVVDNEIAILRAVTRLLDPYGVTVDTAISAREAQMRAGQGVDYDLALLDYRLDGGANGAELALALAQRQSRPPRVVIITGDTSSDEIRSMRETGAEVFFKPLRGEDLLAVVCGILCREEPMPKSGRTG